MNQFSVLTGIPDFTKGLVRELRVRWAMEEMGIPYEEVRYPHPETKKNEYKKKQPFGQVPYFDSGDVCMFESGAILLHLALKHNKLLPSNEVERAHVFTWMFAPLNSIEPFMFHNFNLKNDPDASEASKSKARDLLDQKLEVVSQVLADKEYFSGSFSIAEILMSSVLRIANTQGFLEKYKNLRDYLERNQSRPAFKKALADHLKLYEVTT